MPPPVSRMRILAKAMLGLFSERQAAEAARMLVGVIPGGRGDPPVRSAQELLAAYGTLPWLRACAHKIAIATAAVPWQLYGVKGGREAGRRAREIGSLQGPYRAKELHKLKATGEAKEITTHPFLDLWNQPNPFLTGVATRRLFQLYLDLTGEAFFLKIRNKLGQPFQLWPIPPYWIFATPTPDEHSYRLSFRAWQEDIPENKVLWVKDPHPWNPYSRGSGTAQVLTDELESDEYGAKFIKAYFYNGARPDLIISADDLSEAETARMETSWNQKHQGWWRAFRAHFFSQKVDVQQINQNFQHLQMNELRKTERDIIMQTFGVPPEILGVMEESKYAAAHAADTAFTKWNVIPRLELQRAALQEHLLPEWDERLILSYESPIPKDKEDEIRATQMAPWAPTLNEWRVMQGLDPLTDGTGDTHLKPTNLVEWTPGQEPTLLPEPVAPAPEQPADEEQPDPVKEPVAARHTRALDLVPTPDEPTLEALAETLVPSLRNLFLAAIDQARAGMDLSRLQEALTSRHLPTIRDTIPWDTFGRDLSSIMLLLGQAMEAGARWTARQLQRDLSLATTPHIDTYTSLRAQRRLQQYSGALLYGLIERSQAAIDAILEDALTQGWDAASLAAAIQAVLGLTPSQAQRLDTVRQQGLAAGLDLDEVATRVAEARRTLLLERATTIARHESLTAVHLGQQEAWDAATLAGLLPRDRWKVWTTQPGACTICEEIAALPQNQQVPVQGLFVTPDGTKLAHPPAHVHCRCHAVLVTT